MNQSPDVVDDATCLAKDKSFGRRLMRSAARVLLMLLVVFMSGCFFIAQPTMRSNEVSDKSADPAALRAHVVALSETFHPRDWESLENLNRCADYIADHLKKTGAKVEFQDFTVEGNTYRNVIGRFGVGKNRKIIVGAHYDSCGETPGADDNASGVAGLLELARLIGENAPDAEVELVAYSLEEPPFFGTRQMGSAFHADSVASEKDRIEGVIVFDMIGYFNDAPGSQAYPLPVLKVFYPSRGNFITVVGRMDQGRLIKDLKTSMKGATDLPVYSFRGPEALPGVDFSDHRNYWPHDIPAAMITNTAFYRNHEYHGAGDTADRLDYERIGKVVVGVYEAVQDLVK
jgi:hypothetical protein